MKLIFLYIVALHILFFKYEGTAIEFLFVTWQRIVIINQKLFYSHSMQMFIWKTINYSRNRKDEESPLRIFLSCQ